MTAKDLKNALLQEAVQGKLVPQIASEGNARDLLEEIRKEKLSHGLDFANAKSGKRKQKTETALAGSNPCDIIEEEIPFDIPENWCWCRLGKVFETTSGTTPQSKNPIYYNNGTIGWVRTTDLNNGILSFAEIKITEKAKADCNLKIIPKNSVCIALYGGAGTIGKNAILNFETTINQSVCAILPTKFADMRYLQYFLQWQRPYWMDYASGSRKDPNINQIIVKNCPFPLPPLAEQKRIVIAIEKFMPLIEEYGKKETQLKAINEKIGALTKKAILQEAVQGKLVPQIAAEGNARDLLEKIRKERLSHGFANSYGICGEKCKKSKSSDLRSKSQIRVTKKELPEITEDEIPFDIPESWCWCRLGEIVPFGVCQNAEPQEINDEDWILDLEDIEKDSGKILSFKTKKEVDSKSTKHIFKKGFVLYSKLRPYLNKCVIAPKDGFCTSEILPLDFGDMIYNKYAQLYLMSPFFVDYTNSLSFGVKMPRLGTEDGRKALFPLPPLAEQKRIVAAIEKMLPLCEKLGE